MSWTRTATVSTTLGDDVLLFFSMTAREALSSPFHFEVEMLSQKDDIKLGKLLGEPISIGLETREGAYREFNGIITDFALVGQLGKTFARYRASVRPWLWLLTQRKNSRIFQKKTVLEVLKKIFSEHGFTDIHESLAVDVYKPREFLVQYRETDFNFVSRIMEEEGIYYFFKHEKGKHTLWLCDAVTVHDPVEGYEEVPYYPKLEGERRERDHVDTWFTQCRVRPRAYQAYDFNFEDPKDPMHGELAQNDKESDAQYEIYEYPGGFMQNSAGTEVAKMRFDELQADWEIVKGTGNARGLTAGAAFTLSNFPREDQNKQYLLVDVGYQIHVSGYESGKHEAEPPDFRVSFSAIPANAIFRPPRVTRKPRVEGPQTAIVVGKKDEDIWTDEYGRVKLQFHWDRDKKRNEEASCFVRVAQIWAGTGWGGIHIPRIGQEVIVDFLEGDPDRPIVTGRVYNKMNPVPYKLPDNQTQSGIKSRSTLKGNDDNFNEIRFEDKKGEEDFHMQAEKDMSTLVKHDRTTTIQRNDTLNITGDQFIKIHGNLSMIVEGVTEKTNPDKAKPVKSSLGVTGAHRIDASDSIDIQAPNRITLTCGDSVINMVPGKISITTAGSTIVLDPNIFAQASGKAQMLLDANAFVKANGGGNMLLDANVCAQSNGKSQMLLDGDAALTTSGTVSLHGAKVTGKGDTEAGLDGGGSTIALNAASADLAGNQVNVNAKGVCSVGGPMVKIG